MKQRYQGVFILDLKGKEESVKDIVDSVEKEIVLGGGEIFRTQKMDRKRFARGDHELDSGYFVNIQFSFDPKGLTGLRHKLKFNEHVFRQFYLKEVKPKAYKDTNAAEVSEAASEASG
jgi:ribosomal protein S6